MIFETYKVVPFAVICGAGVLGLCLVPGLRAVGVEVQA